MSVETFLRRLGRVDWMAVAAILLGFWIYGEMRALGASEAERRFWQPRHDMWKSYADTLSARAERMGCYWFDPTEAPYASRKTLEATDSLP